MHLQETTFEEVVERIRSRDPRYARDAYLFVREALDHTQNAIIKLAKDARAAQPLRETDATKEPPVRHVTGQELLTGIRDYALAQFGPMVPTVFEEWGIHRCADFGEIVFNMVEIGLLAKTERDSREDFKNGYDFDEAFRQPFLPSSKAQAPKPIEGVIE